MDQGTVTPKFLTPAMALEAFMCTFRHLFDTAIFDSLKPKRPYCYVVVLVPSPEGNPLVLYEGEEGPRDLSGRPYGKIALSKAMQLWYDRNDDRTECVPHLLMQGDVPYWGGVKRRGIVVTCSGFQPWIDKLVSGIIADTLVALAHAKWVLSPEYLEHKDFIE